MRKGARNAEIGKYNRGEAIRAEVFRHWPLYVLLLPAVVYVFLFSYLPMYGVIIAFKDYRTNLGIWGSQWVGLKHFIRFVQFPNFGPILRNTARIGLYSLATFPVLGDSGAADQRIEQREVQKGRADGDLRAVFSFHGGALLDADAVFKSGHGRDQHADRDDWRRAPVVSDHGEMV